MIQIITIACLLNIVFTYTANPSLYSSIDTIYKEINQMKTNYPNIINIAHCLQDHQIKYLTLGEPTNKVKAIITCGAHARELLSSQVCLYFLKSIIQKWDEFKDLYLLVVPVVNKNRDRVLKGELCLRVNENGVDPNRNYPVNFENGGQNKGTMTYRGPHPLSQKFSQCIDQILSSQQKWNMILDIHTGQLTMFYAQVKNQTLNKQTIKLLKQLKKKYCPICILDTIEHLEGKIAGQMFKYAATKYQVQHSLEFQIYAGSIPFQKQQGRENDKCMKKFSPNTEKSRDFFVNKWIKGLQQLIQNILTLKKQ